MAVSGAQFAFFLATFAAVAVGIGIAVSCLMYARTKRLLFISKAGGGTILPLGMLQ